MNDIWKAMELLEDIMDLTETRNWEVFEKAMEAYKKLEDHNEKCS